MTTYEIWNLIIQGTVGVGTLLVVAMAIWGNLIRSWWSSPKLKICLHDPLGELVPTTNGPPVRHYHLRVTNGRKWAPAHNVRVLLAKVFQPAADGSWVDRSFSGSLQLTWQFPAFHVQFPSIGFDEVCDLGCISKRGQFSLTPYVIPTNFNGFVGANQSIRLEIVAVADNGQSKPILIEIAWNGNWSDEDIEMGRHLVVKDVTS
jgi:hypothetical protein